MLECKKFPISLHKSLGAPDENPFENIVFERFSINGKIVDWSEFSFKTNAPVRLRDEK